MTAEFYLPILPPSINDLWCWSGKRVYNSPAYDGWLKDMGYIANAQRRGRVIVGPYNLTVQLQRPSDNRKRDLDNFAAKALSDLLKNTGVIADDCYCEMLNARWVTNSDGVYVRLDPAGVE